MKGQLNLEGTSVVVADAASRQHGAGYEFTISARRADRADMVLYAETRDERERWVASLAHVIEVANARRDGVAARVARARGGGEERVANPMGAAKADYGSTTSASGARRRRRGRRWRLRGGQRLQLGRGARLPDGGALPQGRARRDGRPRLTYARMIETLHASGVETYQYFSIERDEVYVKLRASAARLGLGHAAAVDYKLPLDARVLRAVCARGLPQHGIGPIAIGDLTEWSPHEHIYAKYDAQPDLQPLYARAAGLRTRSARSTGSSCSRSCSRRARRSRAAASTSTTCSASRRATSSNYLPLHDPAAAKRLERVHTRARSCRARSRTTCSRTTSARSSRSLRIPLPLHVVAPARARGARRERRPARAGHAATAGAERAAARRRCSRGPRCSSSGSGARRRPRCAGA